MSCCWSACITRTQLLRGWGEGLDGAREGGYSHKAGSILWHSKVGHGHVHPVQNNRHSVACQQQVPPRVSKSSFCFCSAAGTEENVSGGNAPALAGCRAHHLWLFENRQT